MLADDKTRAAHFLSAEKKNDDGEKKSDDGAGARAHAVFLGLLASPDWFTREKAVFCLTRLIDQRPARDKKLGLRAEDREGAEDVVPNENESVAGAATIRLVRLALPGAHRARAVAPHARGTVVRRRARVAPLHPRGSAHRAPSGRRRRHRSAAPKKRGTARRPGDLRGCALRVAPHFPPARA